MKTHNSAQIVRLANRRDADRRKELARERSRRRYELQRAGMRRWSIPASEDLPAAMVSRDMIKLEDCADEDTLLEAIGEFLERAAGIK